MRFFIIAILCATFLIQADAVPESDQQRDWLVSRPPSPVMIERVYDPVNNLTYIVMTNGLIERRFVSSPNWATIDFYNHMDNVSLLRAISSEAQITLSNWTTTDNAVESCDIGGLLGQTDRAFVNISEISRMTADPNAFQYVSYHISHPQPRYYWRPKRHADNIPWPPLGRTLTVTFKAPSARPYLQGITVKVHYEMYQGLPVMGKWVSVHNEGNVFHTVEKMTTEILAVTEEQLGEFSHIVPPLLTGQINTGRIMMTSEFTRIAGWSVGGTTVCTKDPLYVTQAYGGCTLLTSTYTWGPSVGLAPSDNFTSFLTLVLVHDSDDKERQGLAERKMYRTLAPQITENPIFMHVSQSDYKSVAAAIDQCKDVGFEMVILSFDTTFNIWNTSEQYLKQMRQLVQYANSKGIEMGGYTLMASSVDAGPDNDCIDPSTGEPEQNACLATEWSDRYFHIIRNFLQHTGLNALETDGPYEGALCASTAHLHHRGVNDSSLAQYNRNMKLYEELRMREVYVNAPDPFYLRGTNKDGMGYVEDNFSLPRWEQILLARQNIYDGTYRKIPTQGWMFVPLVEYHGGGEAATLEPLSQHLPEYEWYLASYFGSGVQAAWRGYRLYDSPMTEELVTKYVKWFNQYRKILTSDIIHGKRPDGRSIDWIMHVNSDPKKCKEAALLMVYNQTPRTLATTLTVNLYYTGLSDTALIRQEETASQEYSLDRGYNVYLPVKLPPLTFTWFVVEPTNTTTASFFDPENTVQIPIH